VAIYTPHLLSPHQGEAAVNCATQILQAGTKNKSKSFSPPVLCQLIRIAGAFVREGVRRARAREMGKSHRRGKAVRTFRDRSSEPDKEEEDFELDLIDDRTLDIYRSFDARDLGVTVFTNQFVAKQLCPTLMRAYMAMDGAEGMDVEREYHFEKFEVKHEVADLLLWLWCHPNGESRNYIVRDLDASALNEFCSSIAGALGFQLEQTCQFILDIRDIRSAHEERFRSLRLPEIPPLSPRDEASVDHHAKFLSFSLFQCRRLFMILCSFSQEASIAASLGGSIRPLKKDAIIKSAAPDLAAMFLNVVDRLTAEDGGIHPELEMHQIASEDRSAALLRRLDQIQQEELNDKLHYFIHSRRFSLLEYGLDVSILIHQLFALSARWHLTAASVGNDGRRTSPFLVAVALNDLCNINQLRNSFKRLGGSPLEMGGSEIDNASYILEKDGHIDVSIWKKSYQIVGSGPDKGRSRRKTAKQDRMSHDDLQNVADVKDIEAFLDDLEHAMASKPENVVAAKWGDAAMNKLEATLLNEGHHLNHTAYEEFLGEWVVSSESFLHKASSAYAHAFDSLVRGRSAELLGSGKLLVKEARKCRGLLPSPHPNTSVFVCFAEERMDLCKAIITGAAGTPFSLGMFEFDILFPTQYPSSPPLFSFRTTGKYGRGGSLVGALMRLTPSAFGNIGDGQRISSNLYNDGKVCISILGTYQAWDDSQRWNPATSSLAQVLASIQTQLLGDEEPYFSEGFNHDAQRGTPAGEIGSMRFNHKVRLHTLRHAMISHLRHPPLGFEEVTKRHFALCRKRVLAQARRWTKEAQDTPLFKSFGKAYEELITLLSSDDLIKHKTPGQAEATTTWGAVPVDCADVRALESCDREFVQSHQIILKSISIDEAADPEHARSVEGDTGLSRGGSSGQHLTGVEVDNDPAGNENTTIGTQSYNPWAAGASHMQNLPQNHNASPNDDEDDFESLYS
jgi:ubiquitin-protein ligase